jgi:AsmA protein
MKALKIAFVALATIVIAAVVMLAIGLPVGFIVGPATARIEAVTGYQVRVTGGAKAGLLPVPNVELRGVNIVDPRRGGTNIAAESIRAEFSFADLFAGRFVPKDVNIARPLIQMPLLRKRNAPDASHAASLANQQDVVPVIPRIVVTDGAVAFVNDGGRVESRLEHINVEVTTMPDNQLQVDATLQPGGEAMHVLLRGNLTNGSAMPVTFTVEAPGMLKGAMTGTAELRTKGPLLAVNGITGTIGSAKFNGWASVDFTSKPFVKLDLDAQRIDLAAIAAAAPQSNSVDPAADWERPWNDAQRDLDALNFVDVELQFSAAELNAGKVRLAPMLLNATLQSGVAKINIAQLGIYGGQIGGTINVDASAPELKQTMQLSVRGVRAMPLLSDVAGFAALDGRTDADFNLAMRGNSDRALFSTMTGTMAVTFRDGELRNLNIGKMVRDLASTTFKGWQNAGSEKTDFTELHAQFEVQDGRATTQNLQMLSPLLRVTGAGTADIGNKTLNFRLDPKLVLSLQGQGGTADPVGLGVPVVVQGTWGKPNIYPDIAGIFDNPGAAFAKMKELSAGLFGGVGGQPGASGGNADIGTMIDRFTKGPNSGAPGRPGDTQQSDWFRQFFGR